PRFQLLPHDLDTILGIGDSSRIRDPEHTLFDVVEDSPTLGPLKPFFRQQEIRRRYYQVLGHLVETTFSKETFDHLVDQHLSDWVPSQQCREVKRFVDRRRNYVISEVKRNLGNRYQRPAKPRAASRLESKSKTSVRLNEVMAASRSGNLPDQVELFNAGNAPVDLSGYSLSDDPENPERFVFPEGTRLDDGAFLVLSSGDSGQPLEFDFGLENGGEHLTLFLPEKDGQREPADSILFGPQIAGHSIGRTGNGDTWTLTTLSPGAPNTPAPAKQPEQLVINEWLAAPGLRYSDDFVELHNPGPTPVAIGGLGISDDPWIEPFKKKLPALSFIGPDSHLVFTARGKQAREACGTDLPFKIAAHQGWLAVTAANEVAIDKVSYDCQKADRSEGRIRPGRPRHETLPHPTPGLPNDGAEELSSPGASALAAGLRISEIMYRPGDKDASEFIELINIGNETLDLEGVRFTDGVEFVFPSHRLEPGQRVLVVENREAFPEGTSIAGEYNGKLNNGGEKILLELPAPSDASILQFTFKDGWHPSTDGKGKSLVIADPEADIATWTSSSGWKASEEDGGTPGR
ncbi:MAG: lamin tail domain-containing protein, partial [Verrucomicrobiota bacterium]